MALSEQEQRLLDEMERSLYQHDADVVSTGASGGLVVTARSITISVLALAAGLAIIVGAMAISQPWAGLLGFVVMIGGIYWAFSSAGRAGGNAASDAVPEMPKTGASAKPGAGGRGFMDRMEDRWDRRQDDRS
ncbi:DUF3040 domain-containing protein [Gulosibacter faecalis]|uniref:DUF3040 domain-containing protein n=1 Tax=Gulosibacter faecalis TaxID=272240 RepID=A0ABW5V139_9MICO|nr:DUF3040 domain-containing protein [Gulosibacter faecalis]